MKTACSSHLQQHLAVPNVKKKTITLLVLHCPVVSTNTGFITDLYNQVKFSIEPVIDGGINYSDYSALVMRSKLPSVYNFLLYKAFCHFRERFLLTVNPLGQNAKSKNVMIDVCKHGCI